MLYNLEHNLMPYKNMYNLSVSQHSCICFLTNTSSLKFSMRKIEILFYSAVNILVIRSLSIHFSFMFYTWLKTTNWFVCDQIHLFTYLFISIPADLIHGKLKEIYFSCSHCSPFSYYTFVTSYFIKVILFSNAFSRYESMDKPKKRDKMEVIKATLMIVKIEYLVGCQKYWKSQNSNNYSFYILFSIKNTHKICGNCL